MTEERQKALDFIHAYMHPTGDDEYERKKLKYRNMAIQALEQQPCPYWDYGLNTCRHANIGALATVDVLGKIRAEMEKAMSDAQEDSRITQDDIDCGICAGIQRALNIIDKYKDKGAEE